MDGNLLENSCINLWVNFLWLAHKPRLSSEEGALLTGHVANELLITTHKALIRMKELLGGIPQFQDLR